MENIKEQLEEVIKKNLPEKKVCHFCGRDFAHSEHWEENGLYFCGPLRDNNSSAGLRPNIPIIGSEEDNGFNQAISQINTSLIADEVLKVVVEKIENLKLKYITSKNNEIYNLTIDDIIKVIK